ncbi:PREDICTED: LOW QUALITY PROTEIN: protocadherin beta-1-like, partial [Acanthisitta chloris]
MALLASAGRVLLSRARPVSASQMLHGSHGLSPTQMPLLHWNTPWFKAFPRNVLRIAAPRRNWKRQEHEAKEGILEAENHHFPSEMSAVTITDWVTAVKSLRGELGSEAAVHSPLGPQKQTRCKSTFRTSDDCLTLRFLWRREGKSHNTSSGSGSSDVYTPERQNKTVYEEFATASWKGIPRAAERAFTPHLLASLWYTEWRFQQQPPKQQRCPHREGIFSLPTLGGDVGQGAARSSIRPGFVGTARQKNRGSCSRRAVRHGLGLLGVFQTPLPLDSWQKPLCFGRCLKMLGAAEEDGWLFWRVKACGRQIGDSKRQVILFILCVCVCQSGAETLRYSLSEEMERDSFVANIAKDLGVPLSQLAARKARVVSEGNEQFFRLNQNTGVLTAKESLDREEICPQSETCTLVFKIFFENPLQLIRGEVEIRDINDNSPVFPEKEMVLKILETTPPGSRFPLESAQDKDVGSNGLQNYSLESNPHFSLAIGTGKDGGKYAELVLQSQLDREEQGELNLFLPSHTATDGGSPPRSGTAQVRIVVMDVNDNIPSFEREVYEARLAENSPPEQLVVRVTAADPDEGPNGEVRYTFTQTSERSRQLFQLNPTTGEIRVAGNLDFEEAKNHKMVVKATDGGGLSAHCKVQVEVLDVNDNAPETALTSLTASIPEDAPPRTVVALFSVRDRDSGDNGRTECSMDEDLPFSLTPTFDNYYELRTNAALDRERTAEYNITITAVDWGAKRLSSQESIFVQISDVNDNPPEFTQEVYTMSVTENS